MNTRGLPGLRAALAAILALLAGAALAAPSAQAAVIEGCRLTPRTGQTASCNFVATQPDEILAETSASWQVFVTHDGQTMTYGSGDDGHCFLEGAFSTGRRLAMCSGAIKPGDSVSAWMHGPGVLIIGDVV